MRARKKGKQEPTCGFCDEKGHTQRGQGCENLRLYKEYLADKDQVISLKFGLLGNPTHHQMIPCPPVIEKLIKERESENINAMPWPIDAKHMVLNRAFFDCNVPHHATRYATDPTDGNHRRNIIEVSYLLTFGANVFEKDGTVHFYYRVDDLLLIIGNKIMGQRRLINQLKPL